MSSRGSRSNQSATSEQGSTANGTVATVATSLAGIGLQPAPVLPLTNVGPAELKDLPTELHLDILGRLSATELMALHVVGLPFKHLTDVNQESLANAIIRKRKREFRTVIEGFNYARYKSMFDALKHWQHQKGSCIIKTQHSTSDFADHYTEMRGGADFQNARKLMGYVEVLMWMEGLHTIPGVKDDDLGYQKGAYMTRSEEFPARLKVNNAVSPDDIDRMMAGELGEVEFNRNKLRESSSWPIRPSTNVLWPFAFNRAVLEDENAFLEMFCLTPMQPSGVGSARGPKLAYCGDVSDVRIIKAVMKRAVKRDIPPLEKASVLEKVFVW
ncbi:hypothetical protein LTR09_010857 [Extremus antarcticus]|uniref:F-box domain-containing protein n=1 Tax=Extremus antarcticus TaxID=702011 RepID=A0AAJ0G4T6_9PEZI|nr:hypothetical protein LTR09_010857 [Extremus antarcticus]